ncbi:MAG: Peroxisomal membrane protein PMP27 [Bogoriella megaspora]|nr:MAG: Peroxisomal membrane protein PMP27 [Bogoriella megaspora]
MVADALIYHPSVDHYLRYVATTVGRDKLLRTLQYFSRFYAWYLYRTNHTASEIAPYEAIKKQFGLSRKLMRVGKFVEHFQAAAKASDARNMDPVLKYCAIGRQLGYGFYLSFDAITYFDAAGIKPNSAAKRLQREAYKAWLFGLICNTVAGFYTLYHLRQRALKIDKKDAEGTVEQKKLQRERNVASLQLVSDLCDIAVPSSAVGYLNLDDGIVGLAGTVSSLIGVWTAWKKTG